jgi:hypothetical protein
MQARLSESVKEFVQARRHPCAGDGCRSLRAYPLAASRSWRRRCRDQDRDAASVFFVPHCGVLSVDRGFGVGGVSDGEVDVACVFGGECDAAEAGEETRRHESHWVVSVGSRRVVVGISVAAWLGRRCVRCSSGSRRVTLAEFAGSKRSRGHRPCGGNASPSREASLSL